MKKDLKFTKMKCGKKSSIPCYCAKKKENNLKKSVYLKNKCSNKDIDVRVGDYYRLLRLKSSMFFHQVIEIENKRKKCVLTLGFTSYKYGAPMGDSQGNKNMINNILAMISTSTRAPEKMKKKYLPRGKQPKLISMIHDRSTMQETDKYKKLYSNIDDDKIHTSKQLRGIDDWGYITKEHVDCIKLMIENGEYLKQYKNKKDDNLYLVTEYNLPYSAWARFPRETVVPALTALLGSIGIIVKPVTIISLPLISALLHKYISSFNNISDSYNCILGAYAFHKNPRLLLEELKNNLKTKKNKKTKKTKKNKKNKKTKNKKTKKRTKKKI